MTEPHLFPITVDRAAYVLPTIGVAALALTAGGAVAMVGGMAISGRVAPNRSELLDSVLTALPFVAAVLTALWWVRRMQRLHRERKLVIDALGITYVAFAGQERVMRWTDIELAEEVEEYGVGEGHSLVYRMGRRRFIVRGSDFQSYSEIRRLTMMHLPHGRRRLARY